MERIKESTVEFPGRFKEIFYEILSSFLIDLLCKLSKSQADFGFVQDLRWRIGVQIIPVTCESSNNFQITIEALEEAYNTAIEANIRVKGLIITNLSNPLGTILDKDTLKSLVNFINESNIHLVCDEIYATTIFRPPHFTSISEVIQDMDSNDDLIHIIYSLSNDLGFPSFRVDIVYSYNDEVVSCARKMSSFGLVL
ncbi:1-aminocyclopropane-1-carboxylate synthase-like [Camellia sinensis]|uniref:1-aminocyclopropane-1-carboxylate synthase-like n=1 Tax=Camellia sinensis TaxID=4442 RepID=UPI00103584BB|nr:1-aminocyclopropane-1-carboxylate synthase-like [Camellia sinensis]